MEKFWIEKSVLPALRGEIILKTNGAAWIVDSVRNLLNSPHFRNNNPDLIPIFERAKEMMELGKTGEVIVKS